MTPKIRRACVIRLHLTAPYIHTWKEAAALLTLPQNLPHSAPTLHELVDEIWYLAGDRAVDVSLFCFRCLIKIANTNANAILNSQAGIRNACSSQESTPPQNST